MKIERDIIIEQCKEGLPSAEKALYHKYAKALYNCCYRLVNDKEESADLLQDVFIKIFASISSFDYSYSFYAWAKRITINHCINHLKRKGITYQSYEDLSILNVATIENTMEKSLDVSAVRKALLQLSTGYRTVFSLYLLEGYDHQEISKILNISVSTSKTQYMRAKNKVKELLKKQGYGRAI